jgi:hypothetical protein
MTCSLLLLSEIGKVAAAVKVWQWNTAEDNVMTYISLCSLD